MSRAHAGADAGDDGDAIARAACRPLSASGACGIDRRRPKASICSTSSSHERLRKRTPQWATPSACSSRRDAASSSPEPRARVRPERRRTACRRRATALFMPISIGASPRVRWRCSRRRRSLPACPSPARPCGSQPSPRSAARRSAAGVEPPTQIGGRGCCTGRGRMADVAHRATSRPSCSGYSSRNAAATSSIASSSSAPRRVKSTPRAANSASRCPAPTPRMTRPPDSASSVANAFAVCERMAVRRHVDVRQQPHAARRGGEEAERRDRVVPDGRHRRGVRARDARRGRTPRRRRSRRGRTPARPAASRPARRSPPTARRRRCSAPRPAAAGRRRSVSGRARSGHGTVESPARHRAVSRDTRRLAHARRAVHRILVEARDDVLAEQLDRVAAPPPAAASRRGRRR